jgi:hypothetical protein
MMRRVIFIFVLTVILYPALSAGQAIYGPEIRQVNNDIIVSFSLSLDGKQSAEIKQGMDKELRFYVDLFRVWKGWPDEFVAGKSYVKTVKADPVKKEYVATSYDGAVIVERRFRSLESMIDWVLSFKDVRLADLRDLDRGKYFVRITVESKVRELPPVIGQLLFFVSENEFKISKDSEVFTVARKR